MKKFDRYFTHDVSEYKRLLKDKFKIDFSIIPASEYNNSQALVCWVDKDANPMTKGKGVVEVRIYFSYVSPMFFVHPLDVKQNHVPYGHLLKRSLIPGAVLEKIKLISDELRNKNLLELSEAEYSILDDTIKTELDDLPATKFQAYFSELI